MRQFLKDHQTDVQWLGGILAVTALLLGLMLNRFLTIVNHDSAIFCILAQSLLKGHYLLVSEPNPQPYFTFPPFLAVQLAGLMLLFQNFDLQAMQPVFKGYIDLLFLLSLPLFYSLIRPLLGQRPAIILTALVAVNPIIFKYSSDILSDTPFWAFSIAALFSGRRFQKSAENNAKPSWRWFGLTLLLIILCALTRQIGMALVVSFLGVLALRKQWKLLALAAVSFLLTVGGWQSYEHFYRSSHRSDISSLNQQGVQAVLDRSPVKLEYVKHFLIDKPVNEDENRMQANPLILAGNIMERIHAYANISLEQLIPPLKFRWDGQKINLAHLLILRITLWLVTLIGLWRLLQAFPFGALYLTIYMAVLLVYPYISQRFLLPTYPLILLCATWGVLHLRDAVLARIPKLRRWSVVKLSILVLLAFIAELPDTIHWVNAGFQLKRANVGPSLRRGNRAYYETLLWIKTHTPPNSLIISRKPPVTYFYSGRKSTAFPFTAHTDRLFAYIQEKKVRYGKIYPYLFIFEDTAFPESQHFLKPVVARYHEQLTLVYTEPATQSHVWRLNY